MSRFSPAFLERARREQQHVLGSLFTDVTNTSTQTALTLEQAHADANASSPWPWIALVAGLGAGAYYLFGPPAKGARR